MVIKEKKNQWVVSDEFNNQRIDYWLKKNFFLLLLILVFVNL